MAEGMVMMMACLAALALLRKVESPALRANCDHGEYTGNSAICCKNCPAGTYAEEFCIVPHTQGICKECIDGENYSNHDNGLKQCLTCIDCKPGFKMIAPCTKKKNTECQCNDGYFCPEGCEECVKCKRRCPEGKVIIGSCNATTDLKCGPPYPDVHVEGEGLHADRSVRSPPNDWTAGTAVIKQYEASDSSFVYIVIGGLVVPVLLVFFMLICYIVYKRRESNSAMKKENKESTDHLIPDNKENVNSTTKAASASQDRLPETVEGENLEMSSREQDNVLPNGPSESSSLEVACLNRQSSGRNDVQSSNKLAVRIKTSCKETLEEVYFQTKDIVGSDYWNKLMRKCGLTHNDIQTIKHDYAQHLDEQHYQMLRTLRDRNGVVVAFDKIFAGLQEMDLNGIYENLINELKSKDLIIKETED